LRGKTLTLELLDRSTAVWGFIGAADFELILDSRKAAEALLKVGETHYSQREYVEAITLATQAIKAEPYFYDGYFLRSAAHLWCGNWDDAVADFAVHQRNYPNNSPELFAAEMGCLRLGVLCLRDPAEYPASSARLLQHLAATHEPRVALLASWACTFASDPAIDVAEAVRLAEQAVAAEPRYSWNVYALAVALYRASRYEEAIERAQESLALASSAPGTWQDWSVNAPLDWFVIALAQHRLGRTVEARESLARAKALGGPLTHPHNVVSYILLRREAEAMIGDAPSSMK
jgi:tetratricopeptide (TPR) repeat protein